MRKKYLGLLLLVFSIQVKAQAPLPNQFTVGNFLEILPGDSLKVYFNCTGTISDKSCADYYRIGKIDRDIINVVGTFTDFYKNGGVSLKASMVQNRLEGEATFYHPNGSIKEQGQYKAGLRNGKWAYFYETGQPEKILDFVNGYPHILESFAQNGKPEVIAGNGTYRNFFNPNLGCSPFAVSGEVKNGLMHGKWYLGYDGASSGDFEVYENGRFVSGKSNRQVYTDKAYVGITQFSPNENLRLTENSLNCPGWSVVEWQYKNEDLQQSFYPAFTQQLNAYPAPVKDQWLIIGVDLLANNQLSKVHVYSSLNDTNLETYVYDQLSSMKGWKTAKLHSNPINSSIYFSVLVVDRQFIIPTHYLYLQN
ncbi:hypothetical protein GU926_00830 [Nibribacter ruber]|uniref:Toxin-antitoxin system YwqK family antitoxin n=1 Tax=Nibribacter ruber TaxID=2698458 RepID=A0A6P1NUQ7_9BACT|nr:hypothetical protein [Nibribacter ruber]QHL86064.1 hypothetical protein GU926_00830 [Nibribacter ruber]